MAEFERLLDDMRARVKRADFSGLAALAPALEAALAEADEIKDAAVLRRVRAKAEENMAFLNAARRGIRAARRRVEDLRQAGKGLQTYDKKGQRAEISLSGPTAGRF